MNFAELVDVLMFEFCIIPARKQTFVGRLQQLQKMGAMPNPGRGKRNNYTRDDCRKMAVILDLIDLGFSPERAVKRALGDTHGALSHLRISPAPPRIKVDIPLRFP